MANQPPTIMTTIRCHHQPRDPWGRDQRPKTLWSTKQGKIIKTGVRQHLINNNSNHLFIRTRNRKIQRPQKRVVSLTTDTEIKNFYININKKVKLKPNLLETIFEGSEEDDSSQQSVIDSEKVKNSISSKKFKRLLTLHDGLNATKALKDKRKSLIKRHLGARKRPKKISKDSFMEYFKKLKQDDEQHNNDVNWGWVELELRRYFVMLQYRREDNDQKRDSTESSAQHSPTFSHENFSFLPCQRSPHIDDFRYFLLIVM